MKSEQDFINQLILSSKCNQGANNSILVDAMINCLARQSSKNIEMKVVGDIVRAGLPATIIKRYNNQLAIDVSGLNNKELEVLNEIIKKYTAEPFCNNVMNEAEVPQVDDCEDYDIDDEFEECSELDRMIEMGQRYGLNYRQFSRLCFLLPKSISKLVDEITLLKSLKIVGCIYGLSTEQFNDFLNHIDEFIS